MDFPPPPGPLIPAADWWGWTESAEAPTPEDIAGFLRRGRGATGTAFRLGGHRPLPARAPGWSEGYPELPVMVNKPVGVHLAYEAGEDGLLWVACDESLAD